MNEKLSAIAAKAADDLRQLVKEGNEKILEAWTAAEEQAVLDDGKPKFKLNFGITLDLDKDTMETDLSWSVKHHLSVSSQIPDPNQAELPIEETVTIKVPGAIPVTMSHDKFSKFVLDEKAAATLRSEKP